MDIMLLAADNSMAPFIGIGLVVVFVVIIILATMADKIDDVRKHQQLATEAYKEATSVQKEYATMNNTVEAGIEKAKKLFMEMTVDILWKHIHSGIWKMLALIILLYKIISLAQCMEY